MVVRNVVRSPVRAVVQSVFGEGESFHPFQLFTSGAQGAWYDPSDFSTLYQDAAGTTPVTAVEQPVRLMLDRSRGLVLGSELVTNGGFDTDITGWDAFGATPATISYSSGALKSVNNGTTGGAGQTFTVTVGKTYVISAELISKTAAASPVLRVGPFSYGNASLVSVGVATPQTITRFFVASHSTIYVSLYDSGTTATAEMVWDNVSLRELPGNHAVAPNDASRPVLRSRYNLLTRTEEFDDAVWPKTRSTITANAGAAPDGTTTADKINQASGQTNHGNVAQNFAFAAGTQYRLSIYAKQDEKTFVTLAENTTDLTSGFVRETWFNLATGTVGTTNGAHTAIIENVGNGWYRCSIMFTGANTSAGRLAVYYVADTDGLATVTDSGGILLWGASLLTAADHAATGGAYQRVGAATDYDTGPPWRPYLAFDGSDDSLSTSSIDFSGTDEMTVFAGVTKLSDAATGTIIELSTTVGPTNNGSFAIFAPENTIEFKSYMRGTANGGRDIDSAAFAAPITAVMYSTADIGANVRQFVVNGVSGTGAESMGTGNFGNYPLFIGRRNNTSNPFNGRLYSLAVLGRTATAPELTAMESWIAGKTGVSL